MKVSVSWSHSPGDGLASESGLLSYPFFPPPSYQSRHMPISGPRPTSPLRGPILRQAGQSLDEELHRHWSDELDPIIVMVMVATVLALLEWARWAWPLGPHPWTITTGALVVWWWGIRRARRIRATGERIRLGRDGERQVGQILEALRGDGFALIHDLPGDDFNLDHIVIGYGGVFVIETKTRSRTPDRAGNQSRIVVNGDQLTCEGRPLLGDALGQAKAEARWLEELLFKLLGEKIPVQPVVVFPGWFIDCERPYDMPVWVCNPKGLVTFIRNSRAGLSAGLQGRIQHALTEHVHLRQQLLDDRVDR